MSPTSLLAAVTLVLKPFPAVAALDHVATRISSYLDDLMVTPLDEVCSIGSSRLLNRIWENSDPEAETVSRSSLCQYLRADIHFYRFQFTKSLRTAAKHHFSGCTSGVEVVEEVARHGRPMILLSVEHGRCGEHGADERNAILWGGDDVINVVIEGHGQLAQWLYENTPDARRNLDSVMRYAVRQGNRSLISCIDVTFDSTTKGATALLSNYGVNVRTKKCDIPKGKLCVLMLDDCQRVYNDDDFWTRLIKGSASWIPDHVRFIISATHLLETDVPHSPVTFGSIEFKLTRDNFLVKDEEAHQCLNLKNGLPPKLRFLHAGRGDDTRVQWAHRSDAKTEEEGLAFYLSGTFVERMARYFGSKHTTPTPNQQKFLSTCLLSDPSCCWQDDASTSCGIPVDTGMTITQWDRNHSCDYGTLITGR
ncbi:hypothetical protein JG687_00010103 [Phytophthora cactorum]|uniref:P-loop containing nucleoside triphosphate hydrolase n=1 Tax=Phytophthora cactorum TaxID=29920 RepID=A0A8T1UCV8_9STRA|nr:hypothetical protein JG687_00010103 [Phytophthora cactorum]